MKLDLVSTFSLADDPDPGARRSIHFAASVGDTLYTIRKDSVMRTWALDAALTPTPIGQVFTTDRTHFFEPQLHVDGRWMVFNEDETILVYDATNPRAPQKICELVDKSIEGVAVGNGRIYVQQRRDGSYRYGSCAIAPSNTKTLVLDEGDPEESDNARIGLVHQGHAYWVTQSNLEVRTLSPNARVGEMKLDTVVGRPIAVMPGRLAVMEVYDDARSGLVFVDMSKPTPNRLVSLCKKHLVRGYQLQGRELYLVVEKSGKRTTSVVVVDVETMEQLASSAPVPGIEDEETWVRWLGVSGDHVAVLQGTGTVTRFRVTR